MKTKLKIIIPTILAIIAVIIAAVCISFSPNASKNIEEMFSTAQKYLVEQNYEQAVAEFSKIIELDPMNADAYLGLAQTYIEMGDTEKAVETLEKGFELTQDERIKALLDELLGDTEDNEEFSEASSSEITETAEITSVVTEEISYTDEELTAVLRQLVENPDADIEQSKLDSIKVICIMGNDLYYASSSENLISCWEAFDVSGCCYTLGDYSISFNDGNTKELTFGEFTSLDFIKRIKNVRSIDVRFGNVNDISAVSEMTEITYLCLADNPLYDISALSNLANLIYLDLSKWTQGIISPLDISVLSNLTNLRSLGLAYNGISDITALSNLANLNYLDLSNNRITNISPLRGLSNLTYLNISNNMNQSMYYENEYEPYLFDSEIPQIDQSILNAYFISDLSPLYELKQLNELRLSDIGEINFDEYVIINDDEKTKLETELPNCKIEYIVY